ncbi:hypothetical protein JAAARDRAFT_37752 [Jaapia argillacea MUCL 33604]|uniref:Uncharacterized protein n=1 Tax=Jaapia argillacea MUCL 33604 TaxID=933084 RepID=A0A067PY11_9AGAM|nr:hypothetical protein JAAARDRAFT_37752 [Jaapia argillacea MUCL 33604]
MDADALRKLGRVEIQALARKNAIKANGKTEYIIRQLLEKHPEGVPLTSESREPSPRPSASQARGKRGKSRRVLRERFAQASVKEELQEPVPPPPEGILREAELEEGIPGEEEGAGPRARQASHPATESFLEREDGLPVSPLPLRSRGPSPPSNRKPSRKNLRAVLRSFTALTDGRSALRQRLDDAETLANRTDEMLVELGNDLMEVEWLRIVLEEDYMRKWKKDPWLSGKTDVPVPKEAVGVDGRVEGRTSLTPMGVGNDVEDEQQGQPKVTIDLSIDTDEEVDPDVTDFRQSGSPPSRPKRRRETGGDSNTDSNCEPDALKRQRCNS